MDFYLILERFTIRFVDIAVHEIGHAIGLGHSNVWNAIMSAYHRPNVNELQLYDEDIKGAQALYGKPA